MERIFLPDHSDFICFQQGLFYNSYDYPVNTLKGGEIVLRENTKRGEKSREGTLERRRQAPGTWPYDNRVSHD